MLQGGFYWQRATDPEGAKNWVIHLQGGGECTTKASCLSKVAAVAA